MVSEPVGYVNGIYDHAMSDRGRIPHVGASWIVEDAARLLADRFERAPAQPRAADRLQPLGGNDDVGVDILEAEGDGLAVDGGDWGH
jgi:hypothetical protein